MPTSFRVNVKDRYTGLRPIEYFKIGGAVIIGAPAVIALTEVYSLPIETTLKLYIAVLVLFLVSNVFGFISMTRYSNRVQERFEQEVFTESGLLVRSGDKALKLDHRLDPIMPSHVTLTDGNNESLWIASIDGDEMIFQPAQ